MGKCYEGVNIPAPISEPCGNEYMSTNCITIPEPIIYLEIPAGSSQTLFNTNTTLAIESVNSKLDNFIEDFADTYATITPLTLSFLNSTWGTKQTGFRVQCPDIQVVYEKTDSGWISQTVTVVT